MRSDETRIDIDHRKITRSRLRGLINTPKLSPVCSLDAPRLTRYATLSTGVKIATTDSAINMADVTRKRFAPILHTIRGNTRGYLPSDDHTSMLVPLLPDAEWYSRRLSNERNTRNARAICVLWRTSRDVTRRSVAESAKQISLTNTGKTLSFVGQLMIHRNDRPSR